MRKILITFFFMILVLAGDVKKGVGCDGGCNANTINQIKANWYYTWEAQPKFQSPVQFVPMCWSPTRKSQLTYSPHLLGFNEPDNAKQANTSPRDAGAVWPNLVAKTCNIGSPAMASNVVATDSWL